MEEAGEGNILREPRGEIREGRGMRKGSRGEENLYTSTADRLKPLQIRRPMFMSHLSLSRRILVSCALC